MLKPTNQRSKATKVSALSCRPSVPIWRCLIILSLYFNCSLTYSVTTIPVDVSNQLTVTYTGLRLNRVTNTYDTLATLTNKTTTEIKSPLQLTIHNISQSGVTVANSVGTLGDGTPYLDIPLSDGILSPGETVKNVLIKFSNSRKVSFTFAHSVFGQITFTEPLSNKPTIVDINLISKTQVDADTIEETYTANLQNNGKNRVGVSALLVEMGEGVSSVDAGLSFGNVLAGQQALSTDTFAIQRNPSMPFTPEELSWDISDNTPPPIAPRTGGILLPGPTNAPLTEATFDYLDKARYTPAVVETDADGNQFFRTMIIIDFDPSVNTDGVNTVLRNIGGRIMAMTEGGATFHVLIPDPGSVANFEQLLANIRVLPGVIGTYKSYLLQLDALPGFRANDSDRSKLAQPMDAIGNHMAVLAPAAWNARMALEYPNSCVPFFLIADLFGQGPVTDVNTNGGGPFTSGSQNTIGHGYHVFGIAAGDFDGLSGQSAPRLDVTGIFPGSPGAEKLASGIIDLVTPGYTNWSYVYFTNGLKNLYQSGVASLCGNGKPKRAILNTSLATNRGAITSPVFGDATGSQFATLYLKALRGPTAFNVRSNREKSYFHASSAGNGNGVNALFNSPWNTAALLPTITDPGGQAVAPLINTLAIENRIANISNQASLSSVTVGGLHPSSNIGGSLGAIGSLSVTPTNCTEPVDDNGGVFSFIGPAGSPPHNRLHDYGCMVGTSMATPQVAGLAAYVWALHPDWTSQQLANRLKHNVQAIPGGQPVIDAYAAILSVDTMPNDPASAPIKAPARLAILDVSDGSITNGRPNEGTDRHFDINDAKLFVDKLFPPNPNNPNQLAASPTAPDYSRYDLNGDGYTGGDNHKARFNLDMDYNANGGSIYSNAGGYDETKVTDFNVLCHYVNSKLFTGVVADFDAYLQTKSQTYNQPISCKPPAKLNDTCITTCMNNFTTGLPCPVAGFPGQDAEHGRDAQALAGSLQKIGGGEAGFDFTKLDNNGNPLPAAAGQWACVKDNVTGLVWQVDTTSGTWFDAQARAQAVNTQGLCGANDWRLPKVTELLSIVNNKSYPGPTIDTGYFPNTPASFVWSSSPYAGNPGYAWGVRFSYGYLDFNPKTGSVHVRLVRGGQ